MTDSDKRSSLLFKSGNGGEKFYLIVRWAVMDAKVLDADKQTDWSKLIIDIFVWLQIYAHIDIPIFIQW